MSSSDHGSSTKPTPTSPPQGSGADPQDQPTGGKTSRSNTPDDPPPRPDSKNDNKKGAGLTGDVATYRLKLFRISASGDDAQAEGEEKGHNTSAKTTPVTTVDFKK